MPVLVYISISHAVLRFLAKGALKIEITTNDFGSSWLPPT
jgi:hypothetical protein